jgi:hypothetical protein
MFVFSRANNVSHFPQEALLPSFNLINRKQIPIVPNKSIEIKVKQFQFAKRLNFAQSIPLTRT